MKRLTLILTAVGALLSTGPVDAQNSRTLDGFLAEANRIPLNATSALRPSAHRLKGEAERQAKGEDVIKSAYDQDRAEAAEAAQDMIAGGAGQQEGLGSEA